MRRIGYRLVLALLLLAGHAAAQPPAALRRGVNITNWFRFPPSRDPATLRAYLDDAAIDNLKRAGFSFVRLPVQPELLDAPDTLIDAIARLEAHGLAVIVALFPTTEPDAPRLMATWRMLAPLLRRFDPALTFPEVLNEPVFAGHPDVWASMQHNALAAIRAVLPKNTIVLTGADWGGIDGLLALAPEADPNVVYSIHFYEPAELTALGAYRANLDRAAMARLPFPVTDAGACEAAARTTADVPTADLIRFYCSQRWDIPKLDARIAEAGGWARRNRATVIVDEFGASEKLNKVARLAWLTAVRTSCERQRIGWALWGYDDSMGFALRPASGHDLDPAVLRALGLTDSIGNK